MAGLLSAILLFTSMGHLRNVYQFWLAISNYRLCPTGASYHIGLAIILSGFLAGIWLLFRPYRRPGTVIALILFATFSVARWSAVFRGIDISCGCFNPNSEHDLSSFTAAVPTTLAIISLVLWSQTRVRSDRSGRGDRNIAGDSGFVAAGGSASS